MRSTTLFSIYTAVIVGMVLALAGLTLHSIERSKWWDARIQLAQESYGLHLQLEANVYRLLKQHADALLIGDRDYGAAERELRMLIAQDISEIREVIAREIEMVGEEEIEELEHLEKIEQDIHKITTALENLTSAGEPLAIDIRLERLTELLELEVDVIFDRRIAAALQEEQEEVAEVVAEASAFRTSNEALIGWGVVFSLAVLSAALVSFNTQIRLPLIRLGETLKSLRREDYDTQTTIGGSREFSDLGKVLADMTAELRRREASREERKRELEATIDTRTRELQNMIRQQERTEANRKRLMADISHELRTPLAIIQGEADVTLRITADLPDDLSDSLSRIRDAAKHTNQIVDDMLTIARQEAGELRLDRKNTDLRKVLHDAAAMFPQEVAIDCPAEPVHAYVDDVRLRQCVLALFHNARRYGGPNIVTMLNHEGDQICIIVEDDGPGMSEEEKAQAFERFFRGSNHAGDGPQGSIGLGLPIVRAIVQAHGGTARLEDVETGGLRVVLNIPARPRVRLIETEIDNGKQQAKS